MAPHTRATAKWGATSRVTSLPEFWTLVAAHSGLVGAWRLTGVCRASREGVKHWLGTRPGLVVCGGEVGGDRSITSEVRRLDMGELRWRPLPGLLQGRCSHACCSVRGSIVVLGGKDRCQEYDSDDSEEEDEEEDSFIDTVEILVRDEQTGERIFKPLPRLSCGVMSSCSAVELDESESDRGQVLLIGKPDNRGYDSMSSDDDEEEIIAAVQKVDLATGVCTPLSDFLGGYAAGYSTIAWSPDGRVVCVSYSSTAQIFEPAEQGSPIEDIAWRSRELPEMSVDRFSSGGCLLSDGRFAVLGGCTSRSMFGPSSATCEVLTLDGNERWEPLPPMHQARHGFACVAVEGCVIVAGGKYRTVDGDLIALTSVEVYEEALGRWRRLPCDLPHDGGVGWFRGALM